MSSASSPSTTRQALWPAIVLGLGFLVFAILHLAAPESYRAVLGLYGFDVFPAPFLDLDGVVAAIQCAGRGVDVYQSNPCDIMGRVHDYSPLWLSLDVLPISRAWTPWLGLGIDVAFIASLALLPPLAHAKDRWIFVAACLSCAVAYLLERCNVDALIFVLIVLAGRLASRSGRSTLSAHGVILLAGLLKFYPLAGFVVLLRESPRRCMGLGLAIGVILAALAWRSRAALATIAQHIPTGWEYADTFGARNLPFGLARSLYVLLPHQGAFWSQASWFAAYVLPLLIMLGLVIRQARRGIDLVHRTDLATAIAGLPPVAAIFLLLGSAIVMGCFAGGASFLYRATFLLLLVPGLLILRRGLAVTAARQACTGALAAIVILMWSEAFMHQTYELAKWPAGLGLANALSSLFWVVRELLWWHVMSVLGALLLVFIRSAPILALPIEAGRSP